MKFSLIDTVAAAVVSAATKISVSLTARKAAYRLFSCRTATRPKTVAFFYVTVIPEAARTTIPTLMDIPSPTGKEILEMGFSQDAFYTRYGTPLFCIRPLRPLLTVTAPVRPSKPVWPSWPTVPLFIPKYARAFLARRRPIVMKLLEGVPYTSCITSRIYTTLFDMTVLFYTLVRT